MEQTLLHFIWSNETPQNSQSNHKKGIWKAFFVDFK